MSNSNEVWAERNYRALRTDPWRGIPVAEKRRIKLPKDWGWEVLGVVCLVAVLIALAYMPSPATGS
jgi:hypothetical protein